MKEGNKVVFITDPSHQRLDELPDHEQFQIQEISVPSPQRDPSEGLIGSISEQKVRTQQIKSILSAAEGQNCDVLHLLWFDRTLVPYTIASLHLKAYDFSVVGTLHRDSFTSSGGGVLKQATRQVSTLSLASVLKSKALDVLTVHADSIKKRLLAQTICISEEDVQVIPAPTPDLSTHCTKQQARKKLNLPQDKPIILFFGGLRYEKGPDILGKELGALNCEITVVFAGSAVDYDEDDVDEWIEGANDSVEVVSHLEFIPESLVDYYFIATDVLVLPYRRKRGISGPMRRACMTGVPIIGNQDSDIGEIIDRYDLGETFTRESGQDLCQAIVSLINSEEDYQNSLENYARKQHWEEAGVALKRLYREVAET
ncbi:glycosyltransferase [Halohasta salina]|uniref:glycosyltransferase n=1 Tax=Halohasta salina TaxID=2961621 RepID=UPI0020A52D9B|nr:glycosyltransferase [Halohasta salina]